MQKHVNLVDLVKSFPTSMYVIATVICPNFHFSVSPHVPFLNLLFEQIAIPTSIYLQKSASIQPRTSSSKFYSILFNIIQYYSIVSLAQTFMPVRGVFVSQTVKNIAICCEIGRNDGEVGKSRKYLPSRRVYVPGRKSAGLTRVRPWR